MEQNLIARFSPEMCPLLNAPVQPTHPPLLLNLRKSVVQGMIWETKRRRWEGDNSMALRELK